MNEEPRRLSIDSELEARLVAMVLGEASDFERDELQRLIEKRPELQAFLEEMKSVHALMEEVGAGDSTMPEDDWKLPEERRAKVIAAIEGRAVPDSSVRLAVSPISETRDWAMIMRRVMSVAALFMAVGLVGWLLLIPGYTEMTGVDLRGGIDIGGEYLGYSPTEETSMVDAEYLPSDGDDSLRFDSESPMSASNGFSFGRPPALLETEGLGETESLGLESMYGSNDTASTPQSALADIRASLGVEAESAAPTTTMPSPYYLQDDVQYFPSGPEFKLSREAAELRAARSAAIAELAELQAARSVGSGEQLPQSGESDALGLGIAGSSQPVAPKLSLPSVNFTTPEDTRLSESRSSSKKGESEDGVAIVMSAVPEASAPPSEASPSTKPSGVSTPWGAAGTLPDPSSDPFGEPADLAEVELGARPERRVRSRFSESFQSQGQAQRQNSGQQRGEDRFDRLKSVPQQSNEQLLAEDGRAANQGVARGLSMGADANKSLGDVDFDSDGLLDEVDSLKLEIAEQRSTRSSPLSARVVQPIVEQPNVELPATGALFGMIGGRAGEEDFGGVALDDKIFADGGIMTDDAFGYARPSTGGVPGNEKLQAGGEVTESARSGFSGGGGFGGGAMGGMGSTGGGIGGQSGDIAGFGRAGGGAIVQNGSTGRPMNRSGNGDFGSGPEGRISGRDYTLPIEMDSSGEVAGSRVAGMLETLEEEQESEGKAKGIINSRAAQESLQRGRSNDIAAIELPMPSNQPLASADRSIDYKIEKGTPVIADFGVDTFGDASVPDLAKRFRSKSIRALQMEGEPADESSTGESSVDKSSIVEVDELQERLSKLSDQADEFSKQRQLLRQSESGLEDLMAGIQVRDESNQSAMSLFDVPSREPTPTPPTKPQVPSSNSLFFLQPSQLEDQAGGEWSTKINREWLDSLGPVDLPEEAKALNGRDLGRDWLRRIEESEKKDVAQSTASEASEMEGIELLDGERYEWEFRETVNRKSKAKKSAPPAGLKELSAAEEAFSTFSLSVSDVSFKLARAALAGGSWPEADKVRIEEFVNAFDYGDPMPSQREKVACQIEQAAHPFLQQRNLMRVSMRTAAAGRSGTTPLRLTLLVDNSGSMDRMDRQQTVRRAFAALAQQLQPIDQVTLISFARQPRLLADQVSGANANQLLEIIRDLPSEGGTNIEAALQLAFEKAIEQKTDQAQNRIILLTDGAVNLGDANPNSLSQMITTMRSNGIAFDAAGISAEGLNDEVLEALTRKGDGRYYLLDSLEAVEDGFARQIAGALRPAAKNVKVQVQFNPERVGQYKLLGFEKHRLKKEDFRNDKVDAAEMAAEEAGVAIYQFEAKPEGDGDIGMVSVRFRDLSTGQMVEKTWPIPYEADAPRLDQASASLRIAGSAALLATKLKGEAMAETVDLKTLSGVVSEIPPSSRNQRVNELQQMIQQARQLSP